VYATKGDGKDGAMGICIPCVAIGGGLGCGLLARLAELLAGEEVEPATPASRPMTLPALSFTLPSPDNSAINLSYSSLTLVAPGARFNGQSLPGSVEI
jgi:hypothetical protein